MALFYYKTGGETGDQFSITIDNCLITLDPITDGDNVWKASASNPDVVELDLLEARVLGTEGATIINAVDYSNLT